jgi:hypothetical protein
MLSAPLHLFTSRDERTFQKDETRVGCVGHPGFGRHETIYVRTLLSYKILFHELSNYFDVSETDIANNIFMEFFSNPVLLAALPPHLRELAMRIKAGHTQRPEPDAACPPVPQRPETAPTPQPETSAAPVIYIPEQAPRALPVETPLQDKIVEKLRATVGEEQLKQWLYDGLFPIREYEQVVEFVCHNAVFETDWKERFLQPFQVVLNHLGIKKTAIAKSDPVVFQEHRRRLSPGEAATLPSPELPKPEEPKDPILAQLEADAEEFRRLDPRGTNEVIKAKLAALLSKMQARREFLRRKATSTPKRTSSWETSGGYTRGDVSDASRALNKGKLKKDYS